MLKRGQPVAELGLITGTAARHPKMDMEGSVTVVGDIIEPAIPEHHRNSDQ